jgi:hypothetical protein
VTNVVKIKAWKRKRAERKVLCDSGFHKWELLTERRFDVKLGKLVSAERCSRCGAERVRGM